MIKNNIQTINNFIKNFKRIKNDKILKYKCLIYKLNFWYL